MENEKLNELKKSGSPGAFTMLKPPIKRKNMNEKRSDKKVKVRAETPPTTPIITVSPIIFLALTLNLKASKKRLVVQPP
ncbi:MAG: hypothetical protein QW327_06370 [Candidatus Odinarchaeota archaeon]